jgi:hypothetical protein
MSRLADIVIGLNALTERARLAGTEKAKTLSHVEQWHLHLPRIWSDVGTLLAEAVRIGALDDPQYTLLRVSVQDAVRSTAHDWQEQVWHLFANYLGLHDLIPKQHRGGDTYGMLSLTENTCAAAAKFVGGLTDGEIESASGNAKPKAGGRPGRPRLSEEKITLYRSVLERWRKAKANEVKKHSFVCGDRDGKKLDAAMTWERDNRSKAPSAREKKRRKATTSTPILFSRAIFCGCTSHYAAACPGMPCATIQFRKENTADFLAKTPRKFSATPGECPPGPMERYRWHPQSDCPTNYFSPS